jgi:hypothetical protein
MLTNLNLSSCLKSELEKLINITLLVQGLHFLAEAFQAFRGKPIFFHLQGLQKGKLHHFIYIYISVLHMINKTARGKLTK